MKIRTPSRETVLLVIAFALTAVWLMGCAWDFQARSDPEAAMAAGNALSAVGDSIGGPIGWLLGAGGAGLTVLGAGAKVMHSLGKQTGRHIGFDEAKGATPAPGQPGSVQP